MGLGRAERLCAAALRCTCRHLQRCRPDGRGDPPDSSRHCRSRGGSKPLVHSAAGEGQQVEAFRAALARSGMEAGTANRRIGESLGRILDATLRATGIRRAVISGGDTSGHGMRQLGLSALTALAPTIPGAALCRAFGDGAHDGLEIALKGGQMGSEDYFGWIRDGGGSREAT
ncbi:nucleotide-binding domain containing protein [Paracoccus aerius]